MYAAVALSIVNHFNSHNPAATFAINSGNIYQRKPIPHCGMLEAWSFGSRPPVLYTVTLQLHSPMPTCRILIDGSVQWTRLVRTLNMHRVHRHPTHQGHELFPNPIFHTLSCLASSSACRNLASYLPMRSAG